jgi:hypothetical protein
MKRIVFDNPETGIASVIIPAPGVDINEEHARLTARGVLPVDAEIVDTADVPTDRTFRNAWKHDKTTAPQKVMVDMPMAKEVAHARRRTKRAEEFAPLDVQATIPAEATAAETKRQAVRDRHAQIQTDIDAASTPDELKAIIDRGGI